MLRDSDGPVDMSREELIDGEGGFEGLVQSQPTNYAWPGMLNVLGGLPGMGDDGGLQGTADGGQGLGLYNSLTDYTNMKGYMG